MTITPKDLITESDTLREFTDAYIECAVWASTDWDGEPLDVGEWVLSDDARSELGSQAEKFIQANSDLLEEHGNYTQAGHDFWLTRNGHGAGFWDRGLGELGDKLTQASEKMGTCDLYAGDDGKIHVF